MRGPAVFPDGVQEVVEVPLAGFCRACDDALQQVQFPKSELFADESTDQGGRGVQPMFVRVAQVATQPVVGLVEQLRGDPDFQQVGAVGEVVGEPGTELFQAAVPVEELRNSVTESTPSRSSRVAISSPYPV